MILKKLVLATVLSAGICIAFMTQSNRLIPLKKGDQDTLKFTVSDAPEWSALFKRSSGWFGADGIFAVPVNGIDKQNKTPVKTMLIFSDTMLGEISKGKLQPGFQMIHNSIAYLNGREPLKETISFYWKTNEKDQPFSVFEPKTKNTKSCEYLWLGDAFVNKDLNNATFIFAYRIKTINESAFGFAEVGNVLIKIPAGSKPPFVDQKQMDTPFFIPAQNGKDEVTFGGSIFVNTANAGASKPDGYVYVYGVKGKEKKVVVARVRPKEFEQFGTWRFWDGIKWSNNINKVAGIADQASNELSVSELPDGRYVMVFMEGIFTNKVGLRVGKTPIGPFGSVINVWDAEDAIEDKNFFTYNAKAHPALSKPGELLISYNVNSFDFSHDLKKYPNLYRPRFIKLKLE
ncbi:DUF4185 domain-containing protein [Pedobacter sp. UYEF25]